MSLIKLRQLGRDDTGANTVEYTLISAIVALGILASLIALKTNLSAIFGGASIQMRASTTQSGAVNASYWASKPLKGQPVTTRDGNLQVVTYTYKDGTVVKYSSSLSQNYFEEVVITEPNKLQSVTARSDSNGNQNYYILSHYDANMTTVLSTERSVVPDSFTGSPAVPYRMSQSYYDAAGNVVSSTGVTAATEPYIAQAVDNNESLKYFRDFGKSS